MKTIYPNTFYITWDKSNFFKLVYRTTNLHELSEIDKEIGSYPSATGMYYHEPHSEELRGKWGRLCKSCYNKITNFKDHGNQRFWLTTEPIILLSTLDVLKKQKIENKAEDILDVTLQNIELSKAEKPEGQYIQIAKRIPFPPGKSALPHQAIGIIRALEMFREQRGVLLDDDPGLGKTIQTIGIINSDPSIKKVLIIVPNTLKINWLSEMVRWLYRKANIWVSNVTSGISGAATVRLPSNDEVDIIITHYDALRASKGLLFTNLYDRNWDLIIVDESHTLKNIAIDRSKRILGTYEDKLRETSALEKMFEIRSELQSQFMQVNYKYIQRTKINSGLIDKAKRVLFLTGSPIVNNLEDLFPFLHGISPKDFCDYNAYIARYGKLALKKLSPENTKNRVNVEFQQLLRSKYMIRRTETVIQGLPEKTQEILLLEVDQLGYLEDEDKVKVNEVISIIKDDLGNGKKCTTLSKTATESLLEGKFESYAESINKLTLLRKTSYLQIKKRIEALAIAKVPAAIEHTRYILGANSEENGNKIVILSHYVRPLALLYKHLGASAVGPAGTGPSSNYNYNPVMIVGGTKDRDEIINSFITNPKCRVFLGTIGTAGFGINLQHGAHTVIILDFDFVAHSIFQAERRVFRIGQKKNVIVYYFAVNNSIDAQVSQVMLAKANLSSEALGDSEEKEEPELRFSCRPSDDPDPYQNLYPTQKDFDNLSLDSTLISIAKDILKDILSSCNNESYDHCSFSMSDMPIVKKLLILPIKNNALAYALFFMVAKYKNLVSHSRLNDILTIVKKKEKIK